MSPWWLSLSAGGAALLLAQATPDPLSQLTGYGALGLVVLGALVGQVRFKPELQALREDMAAMSETFHEDRARMQSQIDALLEVHQKQVLPALLASAEALNTSAHQAALMGAELARWRKRREGP